MVRANDLSRIAARFDNATGQTVSRVVAKYNDGTEQELWPSSQIELLYDWNDFPEGWNERSNSAGNYNITTEVTYYGLPTFKSGGGFHYWWTVPGDTMSDGTTPTLSVYPDAGDYFEWYYRPDTGGESVYWYCQYQDDNNYVFGRLYSDDGLVVGEKVGGTTTDSQSNSTALTGGQDYIIQNYLEDGSGSHGNPANSLQVVVSEWDNSTQTIGTQVNSNTFAYDSGLVGNRGIRFTIDGSNVWWGGGLRGRTGWPGD